MRHPLPEWVKRPASRGLVIAALALAGCSGAILPALTPVAEVTVLRLGATSATLPLAQDLGAQFALSHPDIHFRLETDNHAMLAAPARGPQALWFLTNWLPPVTESDLWAAPLGHDVIVIIAHPEQAVRELSLEQLRALYQGRRLELGMAGGRRLQVVSREAGSGTRAAFERLVMGRRQTTPAAMVAHSSEAMVELVARRPGAIGYVSAAWLDDSVRALRIEGADPPVRYPATGPAGAATGTGSMVAGWPLRSMLFIAGPHEPQDESLRRFIAWAQGPDGQAVLAQRYVPLGPGS